MGRVRRYKKVKAIDPFSKSGKTKINCKDVNLPPDVKNHQAQRLNNLPGGEGARKKKLRRNLPRWAREEVKLTAKKVRNEYAESQKMELAPEPKQPKIEGRRRNETLRQFKTRVHEDTTRLLREEFQGRSSGIKKKKKYLEERKRKNKLKKQGLWEEVKRREQFDEGSDEEDMSVRNRSRSTPSMSRQAAERTRQIDHATGRPDDEVGISFPGQERIRFGEVAHAPPDLAKIPKPRGFSDEGQAKPWARREVRRQGAYGGNHDGDEGTSGDTRAARAQRRQMEEMRERVQRAYSGLKQRRRAGQTQFVGNDL